MQPLAWSMRGRGSDPQPAPGRGASYIMHREALAVTRQLDTDQGNTPPSPHHDPKPVGPHQPCKAEERGVALTTPEAGPLERW